MCLEELAEKGLGREAEFVGDLLNCEASGFEVAFGFAHQVVRNDLLGRLADDSVCNLREIARRDAQTVGIELDIVSLGIMLGNERDEAVVYVDGAPTCLVGFRINESWALRMAVGTSSPIPSRVVMAAESAPATPCFCQPSVL